MGLNHYDIMRLQPLVNPSETNHWYLRIQWFSTILPPSAHEKTDKFTQWFRSSAKFSQHRSNEVLGTARWRFDLNQRIKARKDHGPPRKCSAVRNVHVYLSLHIYNTLHILYIYIYIYIYMYIYIYILYI